ncbi:hypothetical protein WJX82_005668 [Trebouxia sp. C0006]
MDSPRSSSGSPHRRNNMQNYSLDDSAEDPILSNGQQRETSFDRHDQTVFDLSMDYDDDDQLDVMEDTPCVVLHTSRMNISAVSVLGLSGPGQIYGHNDTSEQMVLSFDTILPRPHATLSMDFDYSLRPGLEGLYRSQFTAADGTNNTLGTTQFETSGARLAFPCFDEPALKATFDISLTTTTGLTALSNMPVIATQDLSSGDTTTHFATSPPMSTYLVALIMGNLTSVSTMVPHPEPGQPDRNVSIYGTPDRAGNLETALDITVKVLPAFESLFGIPYTLPKLDLIGIPDFAAGAMENWGLITYRETALLIDPQHASLPDLRSVAYIIAHEMTHQWFGDLVTCDYWGELWLNEGFATYFENYGATAARPEYRFFDTFYATQASLGQIVDAKNVSTHPLATITGVDSTGRVESFFDSISYNKGGSILRMMRAFLNNRRIGDEPYGLRRSLLQSDGDDVFIRSLQQYLRANEFSTGSSHKLWQTVAQVAGLPITRWMEQWTYHGGFPLVSATLQGSQVTVSQVPFTSQGPGTCDPTNTTGTPPWWIPLPFTTDSEDQLNWSIQLDTCVGGHAALINVDPSTQWVKLNAGQYGFYRVNYTQPMWASLAAAAAVSEGGAGTVLGSEDLAGLLDDAYQLSRAGQLSITVYLDLIRSLAQRAEPLVSAWLVGASPLVQIYQSLSMAEGKASCAAEWATFVQQNISSPVVANVTAGTNKGVSITGTISGTDADSESLRLLRPTLLSLAGYFNMTAVSQEAVQLLQDNANDVLGIDPDVRQLVYTQAVANGGAASYNIMQGLYLSASDPSEKERNLAALAYATDPDLRQQTLEMVLDDSVRSQDALSLLAGVAVRSNDAAHAAWSFLTENWTALFQKLGGDNEASRMMGKATQSIASHFAAQSQIDAVNALYTAREQYLSERSYFDNSIDSIQANIQWLRLNAEQVCLWLVAS